MDVYLHTDLPVYLPRAFVSDQHGSEDNTPCLLGQVSRGVLDPRRSTNGVVLMSVACIAIITQNLAPLSRLESGRLKEEASARVCNMSGNPISDSRSLQPSAFEWPKRRNEEQIAPLGMDAPRSISYHFHAALPGTSSGTIFRAIFSMTRRVTSLEDALHTCQHNMHMVITIDDVLFIILTPYTDQ